MSRFRYLGETNRLGKPSGKIPIDSKIAGWQNSQSSLIHVGGLKESAFLDTSNSNAAFTYIFPIEAFRQSGYLIGARIMLGSTVWTNKILRLKIFRWNAGTSLYDYVTQQVFTGLSGAAKSKITVTFNPPIFVNIGDVPGFSSTTEPIRFSNSGINSYTVGGDIVVPDAFATEVTSRSANIDWLMYPPYLSLTGDNIPEGHNVNATPNHGGMHTAGYAGAVKTIPWLVSETEISAQLKAIIGDGTLLKYQNHSLGAQTFNWVATTGIVEAIAVKPNAIIIHAGVNDVSAARTWANIDTDLGTIITALNAASPKPRLLIDEILPWTDGTDLQAASIRTFNNNLASWCAANGASLIKCHDEMGQIRAATGELDDLLALYDYDGMHLTATGVIQMAQIWKRYL